MNGVCVCGHAEDQHLRNGCARCGCIRYKEMGKGRQIFGHRPLGVIYGTLGSEVVER